MRNAWVAAAALFAACGGQPANDGCDPAAFHAVRLAHADRTEVTVCGTIARPGRIRYARGGAHRVFVLDAGPNGRVEVDANLDVMGDFPIRTGERTVVRGEYYADGPGRDGIHWTHRTTHGSHPPGYVILDGVMYR